MNIFYRKLYRKLYRKIVGWVKNIIIEKNHKLNLPLKEESINGYKRESINCSPNSVFKLEMLMIPEIQEKFIEILSIMPLNNGLPENKNRPMDSSRIQNAVKIKLGKYGFRDFMDKINNTVSTKCRHHNGECTLMNNHTYVKIMEVIYTAYIINIQSNDIVMNLACGNTYWCNVWLANQCRRLYANDNGSYVPIHDKNKQIYNYNEYQNGIHSKIEFMEFDATKRFPYSDNMFDKIVSHSSVEHIDNWDSNVLPEIIRTLKPGGKCGLASVYHPLEWENFGKGQSSWWTKKKWKRFVELQGKLGFKIIGNIDYNYGVPWRATEDSDDYKFWGTNYIVNFIFFQKIY